MADITREHGLEALIIDLTDGIMRTWWDIKESTGVSEERAKEMESEISEVFEKYFERNQSNYPFNTKE